MNCEKRRKIMRQLKDGTKFLIFKCANTLAKTYSKEVNDKICQECVLRVPNISFVSSTCQPLVKKFEQPIFDGQLNIIYPQSVETCPEGYHPDGNKCICDWKKCDYRLLNNSVSNAGELIINAFCELSDKKVSLEDCNACTLDKTVPEFPTAKTQVSNYFKAVKKWIKDGRPQRTDEEVKEIHEKYCSTCDWYEEESQRCRGCGCKVKSEGMAIFNKIKMATEHCPRSYW